MNKHNINLDVQMMAQYIMSSRAKVRDAKILLDKAQNLFETSLSEIIENKETEE
jgi:hypothetical protein